MFVYKHKVTALQSITMFIYFLFFVLNSVTTNLFFAWWKLKCQCNEPERIYLLPLSENAVKKKLKYFLACCIISVIVGYALDFEAFCETFLVLFICGFCLRKLSPAEAFCIAKKHKLNLGYGLALNYYENYLKLSFPDRFLERITSFEKYHHVNLDQKLFILVPTSCKIHSEIDNNRYIERCRELERTEIDVAGIKNRVYNITVYLIRSYNDDDSVKEEFRCALEYAQPLKVLLALKNKKIISENKMHQEREEFCDNFECFLHEDDLYKYCKLVKYDDETLKLHEILLEEKKNL